MERERESAAVSAAPPKTQLIVAQKALCRLSELHTCSKHARLSICWILLSHYKQSTSGSRKAASALIVYQFGLTENKKLSVCEYRDRNLFFFLIMQYSCTFRTVCFSGRFESFVHVCVCRGGKA